MYKAVHFSSIKPGVVRIDNYGGLTVKVYAERTMDVKGRVAYLPLDSDTDAPEVLINKRDRSSVCYPKTGKTLYVCSESKVPRALLRNSDYKITINRENADYVVIPEQTPDEIGVRESNITFIVKSGDKMHIYYFLLEFSWGKDINSVNAQMIEQIKTAIQNRIVLEENESAEFYYIGNLVKNKIFFVRKCQELEEILTGEINDFGLGKNKYQIVLDTKLKIDPTNEISAEMLQIWSKMDDKTMLAKHIINSNWQKYPCTISAFIRDKSLEYWGGEQMKYVTKSIDYNHYRTYDSFRPNQEIEPEDWNLLQDYLMAKVGLGPEGGFEKERMDGIFHSVFYAACFKPCRISEPTLYQEIEARLKK